LTKGRPPKPVELKRKTGNPGKRKLPDPITVELLPQAEGIPETPRPLLKPGRRLWDEVWRSGIQWISPTTDMEILLMTCELVNERWNLRVKVMSSDNMGMARRLDSVSNQIVRNLSLLGFTPSDRTRLGVAEVKKASKIQEIMRMKDELSRPRT